MKDETDSVTSHVDSLSCHQALEAGLLQLLPSALRETPQRQCTDARRDSRGTKRTGFGRETSAVSTTSLPSDQSFMLSTSGSAISPPRMSTSFPSVIRTQSPRPEGKFTTTFFFFPEPTSDRSAPWSTATEVDAPAPPSLALGGGPTENESCCLCPRMGGRRLPVS